MQKIFIYGIFVLVLKFKNTMKKIICFSVSKNPVINKTTGGFLKGAKARIMAMPNSRRRAVLQTKGINAATRSFIEGLM